MLNGKLGFTHCGWLKMNCELLNHGLLNTFVLVVFIHYTKPISNQLPYVLPYVSQIRVQQKYQLSEWETVIQIFPPNVQKQNQENIFSNYFHTII